MRQLLPQSLKNLYHGFIALLAVIRFGYPARKLTVIGVTGTDGKTTTANIIYQLLLRSGKKVALISTVGAYIGQDQVDLGFHITTPHPYRLQQLIQRIKREGYHYVVLEATSHGLDQHRLLGTHITYAVVTNITPEHLDYHRTYTRYLQAKAKIFQSCHLALLNADDSSYATLKKIINPRVKIKPYNSNTAASFQSQLDHLWAEPYNHQNAKAAISLAQSLGLNDQEIHQALMVPIPIPGRMEKITLKGDITAIVDFAHTPNALNSALRSARHDCAGNLIAVFGAAGLRDRFKRPQMGDIAAKLADIVVITAEDPRTENVESIIYQIKQGVTQNHAALVSIANRRQAIQFAINYTAKPNGTVIVLGKGHETSLNLDGKTELPWSDKNEIIATQTAVLKV